MDSPIIKNPNLGHSGEIANLIKAFFPWHDETCTVFEERYLQVLAKIATKPNLIRLKTEIIDIRWKHLESLEYFLRFKSSNNELTLRLHSLSYFVEVDKNSFDKFFNQKSSMLHAWLKLSIIPFEMAYKLTTGYFLSKRYGIV